MTGRDVRALRKKLGLTQAQLGEQLGVHGNSVARWERDEMAIRESAAKLLRLLAGNATPPKTVSKGKRR